MSNILTDWMILCSDKLFNKNTILFLTGTIVKHDKFPIGQSLVTSKIIDIIDKKQVKTSSGTTYELDVIHESFKDEFERIKEYIYSMFDRNEKYLNVLRQYNGKQV